MLTGFNFQNDNRVAVAVLWHCLDMNSLKQSNPTWLTFYLCSFLNRSSSVKIFNYPYI